MKIKRLLIFIGLIVLSLIIVCELGWVDLNFYKSFIDSKETTWSKVNKTSHILMKDGRFTSVEYNDENTFSYHIIIKNQDKILYEQDILGIDTVNKIKVVAEFKEVTYSGNYILPIFKKYNMKYNCKINGRGKQSRKMENGLYKIKEITMEAEVKGEIKAKVLGACSVSKAKDLAYDNAIEYIKKYILQELNKK